MFSKRILLATVFAAFSPAWTAAEEIDPASWYFSAEAGLNWMEQGGDFVFITPSFDADFDTGWAVFAAVGHQWNDIRLEFELGWRHNDLESFTLSSSPPAPVTGKTTQFSQMINLLYDADVTDNFELSVGAGLGGVSTKSNWSYATGARIVNDDDYAFAYQLLASAIYELREDLDLFVGYRFFHSPDARLVFDAPLCACADVNTDNHSLTFGVRHFFDAAHAAPVADYVVPPDEKAPDIFIVFFDFNKWSLTADAQAVVAEAADTFARTGAVRVKVIGHTDTVGSAGYNQALSERRAASVAAEMVRLGVPNNAIATEGRGFSDPMVPTGPGVREPQNRRAIIDID